MGESFEAFCSTDCSSMWNWWLLRALVRSLRPFSRLLWLSRLPLLKLFLLKLGMDEIWSRLGLLPMPMPPKNFCDNKMEALSVGLRSCST